MIRLSHPRREAGFSLVEVSIAIGIFAFVIVAILGLFPTAMRLRSESALETRSVMIAQELFAAVRAATNFPEVWAVRDGPLTLSSDRYLSPPEDITQSPVVVGYPANTSVPFFLAASGRGGNPNALWQGNLPADATQNEILTLAKLSAQKITNNLYQVTVEVRAPASAPLDNTRPMVFTTYHYAQ